MAHPKITRALAKRITSAKGGVVTADVFAVIDTERFTLSSFAARAKQRNAAVKTQLEHLMGRIQAWEKTEGKTVQIAFRPEDAAIVVTGPAELLESLAEDDAVAALDSSAA